MANKLKTRNYYLAFEPLFSTIISVATILLIDYLDGKVDVIHYYQIKCHDDHCSGLTNVFQHFVIMTITARTCDTALLERNKNVPCLLISSCHMVDMSYNYISRAHCGHIIR